MNCMIVQGNVVEGFTFIGPFASDEEAEAWAATDRGCRDEPWNLATLVAPEQDLGELVDHAEAGFGA